MNPLLLKTLLGAGAALALVSGGWLAYERVVTRADAQGYARAKGEGALETLKLEARWQKEKDDAVHQAELRKAAAEAAAAATAAANQRLSGLLSSATGRIATASAAAVREYAITANSVFGECKDRYTEVGAKAQGHANDVSTLMDAWPK